MSTGLLLKECPEPTQSFYCWGEHCTAVFYNVHEFRKHKLDAHDEVFEYIWTPPHTTYLKYLNKDVTYDGYFTTEWVERKNSQGRMQAPLESSGRPVRRFGASEEQLRNTRKGHTCFCGKKFKWPRRKYCCDACYTEWNFKLTSFWDGHKSHFLHSEPYRISSDDPVYYYKCRWFCNHCHIELKDESHIEVDHIIAISLGGHPWDYRNLQILCSACHRIKTKSDMGILAWWKRESDYEATYSAARCIAGQLTLEM